MKPPCLAPLLDHPLSRAVREAERAASLGKPMLTFPSIIRWMEAASTYTPLQDEVTTHMKYNCRS